MLTSQEKRFVETARVGRLATVDENDQPHAVPICFAVLDEQLVTPLDEKAKEADPQALTRVQNIRTNPRVAVIVDHYSDDWNQLGWVQLHGHASVETPDTPGHDAAIAALRAKYEQYTTHSLKERPLIRIELTNSMSWGNLRQME